jgi:hypothetical protein
MHATTDAIPLNRFLLELKFQGSGFEDIQEVSARSRDACDEMTNERAPIRLLRSVFVPEDGSCFLLFEAASASAVAEAARRAAAPLGVVWELHRA